MAARSNTYLLTELILGAIYFPLIYYFLKDPRHKRLMLRIWFWIFIAFLSVVLFLFVPTLIAKHFLNKRHPPSQNHSSQLQQNSLQK